ncbi:hypothetical protein SUGI_0690310 [Cryptomeria japonica]|nr:hypothetical protein SUGI_0690310 [Cryptomeria japonica]
MYSNKTESVVNTAYSFSSPVSTGTSCKADNPLTLPETLSDARAPNGRIEAPPLLALEGDSPSLPGAFVSNKAPLPVKEPELNAEPKEDGLEVPDLGCNQNENEELEKPVPEIPANAFCLLESCWNELTSDDLGEFSGVL